jgi:hypothetical protein
MPTTMVFTASGVLFQSLISSIDTGLHYQ